MVRATPEQPPTVPRRVPLKSPLITPPVRRKRRPRRALPGDTPGHPTSVSDAIRAAADSSSWYFANFVSTAGQRGSRERRTVRQALRGLLRQTGVSALPRVAKCGLPIGASAVAVSRVPDGTVHLSGLETCASIWSCPSCAAKIRNHRSSEVSGGLAAHIARGGGALLVTLTLPHELADKLAKTMALVSDGFRAVNAGRGYADDRAAFGILGHIRAFEVTHGVNGWHPHLHVIVCLERPASADVAMSLQARWQAKWDRWLRRRGWRASVAGIGVRVDRVRRDAAAVGAYVAKLQEGEKLDRSVGNEVARADLKSGRQGSRVPFEILADFGSDGQVADLDLWHEYQLATKGRSAIRWSKGLRALLLVVDPELTDEEIAAAEVGGTIIATLNPTLFRQIAGRPYGESCLYVAAEQGGIAGIVRFVRAMGLDPAGVMHPET
jgi:hypothetical protein